METSKKYATIGLVGLGILAVAISLWSFLGSNGTGGPINDSLKSSTVTYSPTSPTHETVSNSSGSGDQSGTISSGGSSGNTSGNPSGGSVSDDSPAATPPPPTSTGGSPPPAATPPVPVAPSAPAPTPPPPPPSPPQNGTVLVTRLFINEYGNTKYSLSVRDPEGVGSFSVKKTSGASSFSGGGNCALAVNSGTVTLQSTDFPLAAVITDCGNPSSTTELGVAMPNLPPPPPQNGVVTANRLFPNQYSNTKYSIYVKDIDGLSSFSVKKANGGNVYGGGGNCSTTATSGTITLVPADFPLSATITDCRNPASRSDLSVGMPPVPPPADLFVFGIDPPDETRSGDYHVRVQFANVGEGVAGNFHIKAVFYYSWRSAIVVEKYLQGGLDSEEIDGTTFTIGSVTGLQRVRVTIDSQNEIVESNETNNTRELTD